MFGETPHALTVTAFDNTDTIVQVRNNFRILELEMDDFKEDIKSAREAALLNDYDTSLIYYQVQGLITY